MGRITPSFRQQLLKYLRELARKKGFYDRLKDKGHREAFNHIVKEAWSGESAAMTNSDIHCITDITNLMANIHVMKCIIELREEIDELEKKLK